MLAMRYADAAVIVTNPEVSSVRDSDRIIGMLDSKTVKAERGEMVEKHILITRYDPARAARGEMLSIDDILEILATPLLGIIPESQDVLKASNVGSPVTLHNADSAPARAYTDAVSRLLGAAQVVAHRGWVLGTGVHGVVLATGAVRQPSGWGLPGLVLLTYRMSIFTRQVTVDPFTGFQHGRGISNSFLISSLQTGSRSALSTRPGSLPWLVP